MDKSLKLNCTFYQSTITILYSCWLILRKIQFEWPPRSNFKIAHQHSVSYRIIAVSIYLTKMVDNWRLWNNLSQEIIASYVYCFVYLSRSLFEAYMSILWRLSAMSQLKAWFSYIVIHRNSFPIYCERSLKKKMISEAQKILSITDHRQ